MPGSEKNRKDMSYCPGPKEGENSNDKSARKRDSRIWKVYGTDYKEMTKTLLAAADLAGRIGDRSLRIGIKPNLVVPSPADYGATTHPEVAAGIVEYLQELGFENLVIAEGSWVGDRTAEAFEYCGYNSLSRKYGVPLVDTQKEKSHEIDCAGMNLFVTDVVDRIDFLINVPVMKGHCQTKMTCALKNLKGLIPNKEKSRFHRMGLHKPIAHLQAGIRQDFIVVDHICGDLDFEEGGNPVVRNCVMAASDPVLVDSYACHLLQYSPDDVPYVRMAEQLGIGSADLSKLEIIRLDRNAGQKNRSGFSDRVCQENIRGGSIMEAGDFPDTGTCLKTGIHLKKGGGYCCGIDEEEELPRRDRVLEVSYAVEAVDSCSACYGNLVHALTRLREEGLLDRLDTRIGIGQGMQGKTGRLGVGRCTKDFNVCIMGCPPEADRVYEELREYILDTGR